MAWWVPKQIFKRDRPVSSATPAQPPLTTTWYIGTYSATGVLLSAVLIPLCVGMLNAGHFVLPMLLFPLPMAGVLNAGWDETITFCVLAAPQCPIYGLFMGYGQGIRGLPSFSVGLVIAHVACVGLAFMSLL